MKLESIQLTNYRCHVNLSVKFEPGFNVVVGINGSGKTSLLKGICESMHGLVRGMSQHHHQPLGEPGHVLLSTVNSSGRYRYEPQFPVQVCAGAKIFDKGCVWTITKKNQADHPTFSGQVPDAAWRSIHLVGNPNVDVIHESSIFPLVAFYRSNRHWNQAQPSQMQAATERNSRMDGYASWWDASLDSASLQSWVIAKCLERFQTSSDTGVSFDNIIDDELALVNFALIAAVEDAKGLRYDMKQKSLQIEWINKGTATRNPTSFENLSDGQRAVIGLVADIARRMCLLNPQLGNDVTLKTSGVVLIDELDMHLHPKWQRIITKGLQDAFPALQFIVASHSPQVLGELQPDQIILLRPEGTSHPQVSYGLDSSQVLEEIMGASSRSPAVEQALSTLFVTLERNELNAARDQLKYLMKLAPGIAELGGAQALLKRKEVLGK